jgi:hypothetical protein
MRKAKVLDKQTSTPTAKAAAAKARNKKVKKVKKWSQLSDNEKDEILGALAFQAGLVEEG